MTTPPVTCGEVTRALLGHLRLRSMSSIILPNVYVGLSPWEADVIRVTPALYWTEYEIKVSVADYRADFLKRQTRWNQDSLRKHDAYASESAIATRSDYGMRHSKVIPKPKQFYFVVPTGMLSGEDIPSHCGLIEFDPADKRQWGIKVARRAPNLREPTRLDMASVFNLAMKASHRLQLGGSR